MPCALVDQVDVQSILLDVATRDVLDEIETVDSYRHKAQYSNIYIHITSTSSKEYRASNCNGQIVHEGVAAAHDREGLCFYKSLAFVCSVT